MAGVEDGDYGVTGCRMKMSEVATVADDGRANGKDGHATAGFSRA